MPLAAQYAFAVASSHRSSVSWSAWVSCCSIAFSCGKSAEIPDTQPFNVSYGNY
jgi:hypothetical protein